MQNSFIAVMTCTENDGSLLFNRYFWKFEDAVNALKREYDALMESLLEDVPEEQIEGFQTEDRASITWQEEGEAITYNLVITEEEIE